MLFIHFFSHVSNFLFQKESDWFSHWFSHLVLISIMFLLLQMGCLRLKTGNSRFGTIKIETSSEKIIPPAIVIATDDCALVLKGSIAKGIS